MSTKTIFYWLVGLTGVMLIFSQPVWAVTDAPGTGETNEVTAVADSIAAEEPAVNETADTTAVAASETTEITPADLDTTEPTLLPDSPFYFLKEWWQKAQLVLTRNETKRAELLMKQANRRLLEAEKFLAKHPDKTEKVEKFLEKYDKDIVKLKEQFQKLKERRLEHLDQMIEKFTDQEIKRQRILQRISEQVDSDKLTQIKERSLERLGEVLKDNVDPEKIEEQLNQILENPQSKVRLNNLHNLEVLQALEEKLPAQALPGIKRAEENVLKKVVQELKALTPAERAIKLEQFIGELAGTTQAELAQPRRVEIMQRLETKAGELRGEIKQIRQRAENK